MSIIAKPKGNVPNAPGELSRCYAGQCERSKMRKLISLFFLLVISFSLAEADDPVVLQLADTTITLSEFDSRFSVYAFDLAAQRGLNLTPEDLPLLNELRPFYLDQLATEFVVRQAGEARGLTVEEDFVNEQIASIKENFDSDEAFLTALEAAGFASEDLLRTLISESELSRRTVLALRQNIEVKDYQLELWYKANQERYTQAAEVCARHILVETLPEAEALRDELVAGADFATLAQEVSIDPGSGPRGGDLGCFPSGVMVPVFEEAAFATPVGELSEIVESQFGFHIILPYDRIEQSVTPLADVREEVLAAVENDVLAKLIEGLRENSTVEVFPDLLSPPEEVDQP